MEKAFFAVPLHLTSRLASGEYIIRNSSPDQGEGRVRAPKPRAVGTIVWSSSAAEQCTPGSAQYEVGLLSGDGLSTFFEARAQLLRAREPPTSRSSSGVQFLALAGSGQSGGGRHGASEDRRSSHCDSDVTIELSLENIC